MNKMIPELRFPEFANSAEWEGKILGDITKVVSKRNSEKKKLPIYSISNKDGFLPQNEQFEGVNSSERGYDISLYKIIERNTFAYNPARIDVGSIGFSADLNNIIISSLYVCFQTLKDVDDKFLWQFFHSFQFKKSVRNNVEGGIRNYLFYENFSRIGITIPKTKEQQKIASCLSSLDEVITAHSQKLELLRNHKKGLMQTLFPKEGEKIPKYRFPEFRTVEKWEYYNGDMLFNSISNKKHNSRLPILAITQEYGAIPRELIDYNVIVTDKSIESYKVVEEGDFIISLRSFQGGIEYSNYKGICSPAYIILRKKVDMEDLFFKYYFKTDLYIRHLNKNLEGMRDGKMVSYKQFSEILLPLPSIQEQQKIASCLYGLDEIITAQAQKIDQLKQHKKGLMQGLFPKMNV